MPDELVLLKKVEKEGQAAATRKSTKIVHIGISANNHESSTIDPRRSWIFPSHIQAGTVAVGSQTGTAVVIGTTVIVSTAPSALPLAANTILPARPNLPHNGFQTVEEGEKAFTHLLKKVGVDANWTWDQTMRAIITDPLYKALNTLAEKKVHFCMVLLNRHLHVFPVYQQNEQEEREACLSKLRLAI